MEIKKITSKYSIEKLIILQDQRILCLQKFGDKDVKTKYIFFVYDTNNNFKCDFSSETNNANNTSQMNDGNIIISYRCCYEGKIKAVKVKKKFFEIIQDLNDIYSYNNIYKISEEMAVITEYNCFKFYS